MTHLIQALFRKWIPKRGTTPIAPRFEVENLSSAATVTQVQTWIREAETGNTRNLFALYRDLAMAGSHVQTELSKRKLALLGDVQTIQPASDENPDDVMAAKACRQMVDNCENWLDGMIHLLDATLWPVSVLEKVFTGQDLSPGSGELRLQYTLRRFEIVDPQLLCFRDYYRTEPDPEKRRKARDRWEPDLRFYEVGDDGQVIWDMDKCYHAEPMRHVIHRGHALVGVRDNWGGPMRAVVFWWLLAELGREWFARFMERYGSPFIVGKTSGQDQDSINFLNTAFSLSTKIGGLVVDQSTQIELKEVATQGAADAYDRFLGICNREISKVVIGQELSSTAQATGLGSGVADLHGQVRDDIRQFDSKRLGETIRTQIFKPFLQINGMRGRPPVIQWGGESKDEAELSGALLTAMAAAGLRPTEAALPVLSQKFGFEIERNPNPTGGFGNPGFGGFSVQSTRKRVTGWDFKGQHALLHPFNTEVDMVRGEDPTTEIARLREKALAQAYRGAMAPFRQAILSARSKEEALTNLAKLYPDWKPERLAAELNEAMQIAAAAGARDGKA